MKVHVEQQQERSKNKSMETLMQTHQTNQTWNNGMPKQSLSSTAPYGIHSFLLLPHYCISVLASRGAVSEIKAI